MNTQQEEKLQSDKPIYPRLQRLPVFESIISTRDALKSISYSKEYVRYFQKSCLTHPDDGYFSEMINPSQENKLI